MLPYKCDLDLYGILGRSQETDELLHQFVVLLFLFILTMLLVCALYYQVLKKVIKGSSVKHAELFFLTSG